MSKNTPIKDEIIRQLDKSDMSAHGLKEALGIMSYWTIWDAIKELKDAGEIEQYFRLIAPSATLYFCLPGRKKEPLSVRWNRGIRPWTPSTNITTKDKL